MSDTGHGAWVPSFEWQVWLLSIIKRVFTAPNIRLCKNISDGLFIETLQDYTYCQDVPASLQYDSEKLIGFYLLNEKMNLLLLNAASGSKLGQVLEKLVDFGMDAGKDIFVAILIYSVGRFIIKQISVLIAKVLEKRKIETLGSSKC